MDFERKKFESVYSNKVKAGRRRTYFFDVRETKGNDFYVTITDSKKRFEGEGYERHKIFLYKEDFNRFLDSLEQTINHVKVELMPDYDYDEYTRRHEEYERKLAAGEFDKPEEKSTAEVQIPKEEAPKEEAPKVKDEWDDVNKSDDDSDSEEDLSW